MTRTEVPADSDPKHSTRIVSAYPLPHCQCALSAALKKSGAESVTSWIVPHTSPRVIVTVNLSIVTSSLCHCTEHPEDRFSRFKQINDERLCLEVDRYPARQRMIEPHRLLLLYRISKRLPKRDTCL